MPLLQEIFTAQSPVGQMIQSTISKETDGFLAQGAMQMRNGETPSEYQDRMAKAMAYAVSSFNNAALTIKGNGGSNFKASFKQGAIAATIERYLGKAVYIFCFCYGLYLLFKPKK
jgi:hypothetical protein